MKKLIVMFLAVGVAFAFATNVKAQTQNITVTANVLQAIEFSTITNVSFGTVQINSGAEVQANEHDGTTTSNASGSTAGAVTITGGAQDYIITQNAAGTLALEGNSETTLAFTPRYFQGANNRTVAITGDGYTVAEGGSITLDIGGALASPGTAGSYSTANGGGAPLQLQVAYTGI